MFWCWGSFSLSRLYFSCLYMPQLSIRKKCWSSSLVYMHVVEYTVHGDSLIWDIWCRRSSKAKRSLSCMPETLVVVAWRSPLQEAISSQGDALTHELGPMTYLDVHAPQLSAGELLRQFIGSCSPSVCWSGYLHTQSLVEHLHYQIQAVFSLCPLVLWYSHTVIGSL